MKQNFKTFKLLTAVAVTLFLSINFISCDKDGDDFAGGKSSLYGKWELIDTELPAEYYDEYGYDDDGYDDDDYRYAGYEFTKDGVLKAYEWNWSEDSPGVESNNQTATYEYKEQSHILTIDYMLTLVYNVEKLTKSEMIWSGSIMKTGDVTIYSSTMTLRKVNDFNWQEKYTNWRKKLEEQKALDKSLISSIINNRIYTGTDSDGKKIRATFEENEYTLEMWSDYSGNYSSYGYGTWAVENGRLHLYRNNSSYYNSSYSGTVQNNGGEFGLYLLNGGERDESGYIISLKADAEAKKDLQLIQDIKNYQTYTGTGSDGENIMVTFSGNQYSIRFVRNSSYWDRGNWTVTKGQLVLDSNYGLNWNPASIQNLGSSITLTNQNRYTVALKAE